MTEEQKSVINDPAPSTKPLAYNVTTVNATDTVGVVFVGVLALFLLIALLRAQVHNRKLRAQLAQQCCDCGDDPGGS